MSKRPETFENNDVSALNASVYMTGALRVVFTELDLIEGTDRIWKDSFESDPAALVRLWPKVLESVAKMQRALGQD